MPAEVITTVTIAANSYDLTDLATVKVELGISGTAQDAQLDHYITAASLAAAQYCNRVFPAETVQDRFDLTFPRMRYGGDGKLQLSRWPVISVTSITENGVVLVAETDYRLDAANGTLWRLSPTTGNVTSWGTTPVLAVYQAGYASIPADLEDAAIRMIRTRWFAKDRDPMARSVNVVGVLEQQFWVPTGTDAGNMTVDVADILNNYRAPVLV